MQSWCIAPSFTIWTGTFIVSKSGTRLINKARHIIHDLMNLQVTHLMGYHPGQGAYLEPFLSYSEAVMKTVYVAHSTNLTYKKYN